LLNLYGLFWVVFKLNHTRSRHIWGYRFWLILNSVIVWSTGFTGSNYPPISERESFFLSLAFPLCYGKTVGLYLLMIDSYFRVFSPPLKQDPLYFYKRRTHLEVLQMRIPKFFWLSILHVTTNNRVLFFLYLWIGATPIVSTLLLLILGLGS